MRASANEHPEPPHPTGHGPHHTSPRRPETTAAGKRALGMRYRLLPYLYTSFHSAHTSGAPVMRPLWMNFPADRRTHTNDRRATCRGWAVLGGRRRVNEHAVCLCASTGPAARTHPPI